LFLYMYLIALVSVLPSVCRFARFLGILTLESFTAAALGLSVGAAAPNADAAVAIGPAVMLVWIIFGGYYCNSENIPRWAIKAIQRGSAAAAAAPCYCVQLFLLLPWDSLCEVCFIRL
jgi:ABC-type multidrug transport system permease subunit